MSRTRLGKMVPQGLADMVKARLPETQSLGVIVRLCGKFGETAALLVATTATGWMHWLVIRWPDQSPQAQGHGAMSTGKGMSGSPKSADSVIMTDHAMA
jgi:hypothetical protein